MERQVKANQVLSKLKIATFAADLRADERTGAFGVGKIRRLAIPLDQIQAFVKLAEV